MLIEKCGIGLITNHLERKPLSVRPDSSPPKIIGSYLNQRDIDAASPGSVCRPRRQFGRRAVRLRDVSPSVWRRLGRCWPVLEIEELLVEKKRSVGQHLIDSQLSSRAEVEHGWGLLVFGWVTAWENRLRCWGLAERWPELYVNGAEVRPCLGGLVFWPLGKRDYSALLAIGGSECCWF
jgi:hypothetical protein